MRATLLMAGLGLAVMSATEASELAITAFDRAGRLTFQEVPSAVSYRVEWTTNLGSAVWSSNSPGLSGIPPLGAGSQIVTVGVAQAACYYRVVAAVTNEPAVGLTNTFDLSSENWRVVSCPYGTHVPNPETSALLHVGSFGNPPGCVQVGDVYYETGISAPAEYLGNKLAFYGGSLAYDIFIRYTDADPYPAVELNGGTMSLHYNAPSPPLSTWQRRIVPLSEAGWKISGTGANATEADFKAVLGHLAGLYIATEWHVGTDDTNIDNITMTPP